MNGNASSWREVKSDLLVLLSALDLHTAEAYVTLPREMILDPLCGVLQLRVGARFEVRDYVGRVSIARDHRGVVGLVEADDSRDVRLDSQLGGDPLDASLCRRRPNVTGAHDRHDPGVDLPARGRLEPVRGRTDCVAGSSAA